MSRCTECNKKIFTIFINTELINPLVDTSATCVAGSGFLPEPALSTGFPSLTVFLTDRLVIWTRFIIPPGDIFIEIFARDLRTSATLYQQPHVGTAESDPAPHEDCHHGGE